MQIDDENLIRRIADYERISGILWIVLAIIQICTCIGAVAGIWNIFAGRSRLKIAPQIRLRNPNVPKAFESIGQLVVIGAINLLLGGVIGVIFVGFDFFIRDKVLTNNRLFTGVQPAASVVTAPPLVGDASTSPGKEFDQQMRLLAKLKEDGVITAEDFDRKKRDILGV